MEATPCESLCPELVGFDHCGNAVAWLDLYTRDINVQVAVCACYLGFHPHLSWSPANPEHCSFAQHLNLRYIQRRVGPGLKGFYLASKRTPESL